MVRSVEAGGEARSLGRPPMSRIGTERAAPADAGRDPLGVMRLASDARELRHTPRVQHEVLLDGAAELLGAERAFHIHYDRFAKGLVPQLVRVYVQPRVGRVFRSYL